MGPGLFDALQKIAATFALFVGGGWVLMNYVRNLTHVPRLQIDIKAEIVDLAGGPYLLATIQVRNLGLSVIRLPEPVEEGAGPGGSALLVSPLADEVAETDIIDNRWDGVRAFPVLVNHTSIEPGLAINEQRLLRLPLAGVAAYRVRSRILAHQQSWSATAITVADVGRKGVGDTRKEHC
jgi:hypothetical protein